MHLFETRAALLAWLEKSGLAHVARLNCQPLERFMPKAQVAVVANAGSKHRLIELASKEQLRGAEWLSPASLRSVASTAALTFIETEAANTKAARDTLATRLPRPRGARAEALFDTLSQLLSKAASSAAPRLELPLEQLSLDAGLPGFVWRDWVPSETRYSSTFTKPTVRIRVSSAKVTCSCKFEACAHTRAALETAMRWCTQATTEKFEASLLELTRPAWQRTLETLDEVFAKPLALSEAALKLVWAIRVVGPVSVEVCALVQRKGWVETPKWQLMQLFGAKLNEADAKIASLLPSERSEFASRVLLEALVDQHNVVLREAPQRVVMVEKSLVGLAAEDRLGTVFVRASVDGASLPDALRERVRVSKPLEPLFFWDEGQRRLTLLEVKPELRTVLGVLHESGESFPPESHSALLGALSKWAQHVPVAMPRSVMGEPVASSNALVLRVQPEAGGHVMVEIRTRAMTDAPALVPGQGAVDVHVRRAEKAFHARRDFAAETAAAEALSKVLPLFKAEPWEHAPFQYRFETPAGALEAIEAASHFSPPVELEWAGKAFRSAGHRGAGALRVVLEERREWFGVLGELNVCGERVELARLIEAARRHDRYVEVNPQTYVELSDSLRALLEKLGDHVHVTKSGALEVGPSAIEALQALAIDGAELDVTAAQSWVELERRMLTAKGLKLEKPPELKADLRAYQQKGFEWLATLAAWGAGAVLADDMGLGKTVQALAVMLQRTMLGPTLVLAPTSVAFNWQHEAAKFAPSLRLFVYADEADRDGCLDQLKAGDVLVVSYGLLVRDVQRLQRVHFATGVFDEAQAMKNAKTQRFRAARQLTCDFKVALSGTPLENHLGELWALFALVFPQLLGSWEAFRTRYALPIEKQVDPLAAPALARVIAPFLLRRTKDQVAPELPPRIEINVPVVLSAAEWQLYEDARLAALSDLESSRVTMCEQERHLEVLAALTKLRLIASHPRLHDPSSKLESSKLHRLLELIEELRRTGQRALIFSQFTTHLGLVREALDARGIASVYLDGQTPRRERETRVDEFQRGDAPLFLISLKAGGVGLNLTQASTVIHLDPWWNPAVEDQASDRAHRLGQTKPVTIYRLVAMGTLEETMLSLHAAKRSLISRVLEGSDQAGRLTTAQLISFMAQKKGPAAEPGPSNE